MALVHFNTAGAGLPASSTVEAMTAYLLSESRYGAYETEAAYAQTLNGTRNRLAGLLGVASSDQIALFDSGTRAWHTCVNAITTWPRGGRVWTTPYEYAGNLLALQTLCRRFELHLQVIPTTGDGELDLDWMMEQADDRLCLVSIVHIPSACGTVLPIDAIGKILREESPQALYAVDACQSVGQLSINCVEIGCDLLTAAGRKFLRGPRGTGFAFVSSRWLARAGDHPVDLHAADVKSLNERHVHDGTARRLELTEMHCAAIVGLGDAIANAEKVDLGEARALYRELGDRLRDNPKLSVLTPGRHHSGILSFVHRNCAAATVVEHLRACRINAWVIKGTHTPLYMSREKIDTAVRLSLHCTNQASDLDLLDQALFTLEQRNLIS
ncbi:aminotransferase class V-fold PLP-dependent enzyme [Burkholderia ubonensis]|uniref:aminotransferase class V-fold PLP-dependent enzyme n=1 Tax=Burkholderia ubonensis TaxID=101571 RepID=UPI00075309BD|nr:aminotransferase class V-fold PLP-dependent enzyme [Burkholderia ubonensis]KVW36491.1 aminotransferase [Burkholderia ubonensis]